MDTQEPTPPEVRLTSTPEKQLPSPGVIWLSLLITPSLSLLTALAHSELIGIITFFSSPVTAIIAGVIMVKKIQPKWPRLAGFTIIILLMVANASVSLAGCATLNSK
ncbi:MAG: hypothetical protein JWN25_804 [Verrucomicrobiales bacterium]|nr:hypothetical protein [Verrucomicrobiales bacterium]